jgi:hypothetical protein
MVMLGLAATLPAGCIPLPAGNAQKAAKNAPPPPPAGGVQVVAPPPPPAQTAASAGVASTPASGRLWVVVKNLQVSRGLGRLESEISADWEVVQGSPEPGAKYVLRVSDADSGSIIEHYVDFDIDLSQRSGKVQEAFRGPSFGIRGGVVAAVGKASGTLGRNEIDLVSGKCRMGGSSDPTPAPTVVEAAGQAAQGMPIAIANARHAEGGIGISRGGWSIDYQIQGSLSPGERYYWIVKDASGGGVEFDVTSDLAFPGRAKNGTLSGSAIGPGRLSGQLQMYIERRGFGFNSDGKIVSNTVTLN